ncbi:MAG: CYTH domain-containing protein [Eubacteriales bacterium]|nr:CYTH domain-containing protein [Eubacteriales bacterium]
MGYEIERKWNPSMEDARRLAEGAPFKEIVQGYVCTDPVIRIRRDGDEYYVTVKGKGTLKREEINLPVTKEAYDELMEKSSGRIISKRRYRIPYEGRTIELDFFNGKYEGLLILEIEFENEEEARDFNAPECFGAEVTGDYRFTNAYLSQNL